MEALEREISSLDLRYSKLRLASPETEAWLRRSIEREGIREAVVVSLGVDEGKLVVVDGFKRLRVAEALGWEVVPVREVQLDVGGSHAAMLALNRPRRGLREVEEGWLVRSLIRECGQTQTEVGELLGRHKSWVCRRLKLVEHLEDEVQEQLRLGLLPAATARELARLPRGNQVAGARTIAEHHLTSRQAAGWVKGMLKADWEVRQTLLIDPQEYLRVQEAEAERRSGPAPDPRLSKAANMLIERVYWLEQAARTMRGACQGGIGEGLGGVERDVVAPLLRRGMKEAGQAVQSIRKLLGRDTSPCKEGQGGEEALPADTSQLGGGES